MGVFRGLWVDDERPIPDDLIAQGWTCAPSFHEAVLKLELLDFDEVSLDHDLASFYGNREMTGYDVLMWLVDRHMNGGYVPPKIHVHTANPVGRDRMIGVLNRYLPGFYTVDPCTCEEV